MLIASMDLLKLLERSWMRSDFSGLKWGVHLVVLNGEGALSGLE